MSKNKKKKKPEVKAVTKPAWDKETWMALSNVKLGVQSFVVAGALHQCKPGAKLTEDEVKKLLEAFLNQSL